MLPSQPHPSPEFIKKIHSDIQKSGFPLELHVLNVCSKKNTGRMPSVRYEYAGKLREIDLLTTFEHIDVDFDLGNNGVLQHTIVELIIECKKSHNPWIFFSAPAFAGKNVVPFLKYHSDFDLYFSSKRLPSLLAQICQSVHVGHYGAQTIRKCISYHKAFAGKSGPRGIYRAIDSVVTYLNYARESRLQSGKKLGNLSKFYIPVIVLDGLLLEGTLKKGEIELHSRPHLQLRTFHREDIYVIDVVTKDHFEQFFNEIHHFHRRLVAAIRSIEFPSDLKAAVKARLKKQWDSPDPRLRDVLLASLRDSRQTRVVRKRARKQDIREKRKDRNHGQ